MCNLRNFQSFVTKPISKQTQTSNFKIVDNQSSSLKSSTKQVSKMLSKISLRVLLRPKIAAPSMHQRYYSVDNISTKPSMDDISVKEKSVSDASFATLLRNSTFVQMGNPIGKVSF
jgi:hypothetical protein